MEITPLDVAMAFIILFFVSLGTYRGLFREILSLIGFVAGIYLAAYYYAPLAKWALQWFPSFPALVNIFSFFFILAIVVFAMGVLGVVFRKLLVIGELNVVDRMLGGAFGLLKAFLINAFIVILLVTFTSWGGKIVEKSPLARETQYLTKTAIKFAPPELKNKFFTRWRSILGGEE